MRGCAVLPYLAFVLMVPLVLTAAAPPCQAADAARDRARAIAARVGISWGDDLVEVDEAPAPPVSAPAAPAVVRRPVAPPVDALTPDEVVRQIKLVKFQLAQLEASWSPGAISPTYEGTVRNLRRRLKRLYARLGTLVATGPGL